MTIEELCKRSHNTAVVKGWHKEKRTFGEAIALFHSEVSEALECYRDPKHESGDIWFSEGGKPEGIVIELADLLIRIGDTVVDMNLLPMIESMFSQCEKVSDLRLPYGCDDEVKLGIPDLLARIHGDLSEAFEDGGNDSDRAFSLGKAMEDVGTLCLSRGWDLEKAVLMKMEYNEHRPYRHGGKRA